MSPKPEFIPIGDQFEERERRLPTWEQAELAYAISREGDQLTLAKSAIFSILIVLACACVVMGGWELVRRMMS